MSQHTRAVTRTHDDTPTLTLSCMTNLLRAIAHEAESVLVLRVVTGAQHLQYSWVKERGME